MATDLKIGGATIVDLNPATGEVLGELPCTTREEVFAVVERA